VNVAYNITTKKKPKHMDWSNPIDKIYRDLQDAKDQAEAMKNDADQDGIPDYLDLEPNTKPGYKVDNKGVTLDSDDDGIPDTIDPDPFGFDKTMGLYFPAGIGIGKDTSERVYQFSDSVPQTEFVTISKSGYGLPTVVFPPNRFTVHVEQYNLLQQIARILLVDTSASLVIIGHSDNNKPNLTQLTLAERRALEVKRKLYKIYEIDEERMLVFSSKDPYVEKYQMSTEGLDRKVEFRIIRPVQKRRPRVDTEDLNDR
jgi:OOP family OmpA-OmpF porin